MKLLQAAVAVLFVLLAAGCATQSAPKATPAPWTREAPIVPPMTTYGCDSLLAMHLGQSC